MKNFYILSVSEYLDLETFGTLQLIGEYNSVLNFIDTQGNLFSIVKKDICNGPFNIVVNNTNFNEIKRCIAKECEIFKKNYKIIFESRLKLSVNDKTELWSPVMDVHFRQESELLLIEAINYFKTMSAGKGISNFLRMLDNQSIIETGINYKITKIIYDSFSMLLHNYKNNRNYLKNIGNIIGLGQGLTPAGDDFICGAVIGFYYFYETSEFSPMLNAIQDICEKKTNKLSANYIKSACKSLVNEKTKKFLNSLTYQSQTLFLDIKSVLDTGETSGIDFLTGFFASYLVGYDIFREWRQ